MFIDVAAFDASRETLLIGECTWSSRRVGTDVLDRLEATAEPLVREHGEARVLRALFSRSGFTASLQRRAAAEKDIVLVHGLAPLQS